LSIRAEPNRQCWYLPPIIATRIARPVREVCRCSESHLATTELAPPTVTVEPRDTLIVRHRVIKTASNGPDTNSYQVVTTRKDGASSVHNYLSTPEQAGYVIKHNDTYRLGLRHLALGGKIRHREQIHEFGNQEATELANETGELANLLVEGNGRGT
jgi:hypothetical protein